MKPIETIKTIIINHQYPTKKSLVAIKNCVSGGSLLLSQNISTIFGTTIVISTIIDAIITTTIAAGYMSAPFSFFEMLDTFST